MTTDQVRAAILDALSPLPVEVRQEAADAFILSRAEELRDQFDIKHGVYGDLFDSDTYYAVHDDDLKLLTEAAVVAAAAYAAFPNPVSVIAGLVVLVFRFRRKRIRLDSNQAVVLRAIAAQGPSGITLKDLLPSLPESLRQEGLVATIITGLTKARKDDGSSAKLLEQEHDRIYAVDI
jgi:hypothetical protein